MENYKHFEFESGFWDYLVQHPIAYSSFLGTSMLLNIVKDFLHHIYRIELRVTGL